MVIIGAGPRGAGLLERLCANTPELFPDRQLEIHLVDPYPFGAGRIWRWDQSPLLWANSMAADTTMFTDDSCTIDGPIRPGPDLAEWAAQTRETPMRDDRLNAELRSLTGASFPSRQLVNDYLAWMFWRTVSAAPANVSIRVHPERALDLTDAPGGRQQVVLEHTRNPLTADLVLLAVGHLPSEPLGESAELAAFAQRHGLAYLAESYTADADLSQFGPGDDVIVRGFGLAFIDLMVLLTEGRGGTYHEDDDGRLVYRPSGAEPRLLVGSRRGVPYRSKLTYPLVGPPPPHPRFLDAAAVDRLLARPQAVDVEADVWPLIVREILFGYYHELFLGHPDRVQVPWAEFEPVLARTALSDLPARVAAVVPDPADRFDLDAFDRPLRGQTFADTDELQDRVRAHLDADLARRSDQHFSADLGAFGALLAVLVPLSRLMSSGRISVSSQIVDLPRFFGFFSYFASGPPPQRLRELRALSAAGVVRFLGPDIELHCQETAFVAFSPAAPGRTRARAVVEARIPGTTLAASADPLVHALYTRGELAEQELTAPEGGATIGTGRVLVSPDFQIIDMAGRAHPRRYAFGAWTSAATAAAFSRPRTNSPFFLQNDAAARNVLRLLQQPTVGLATEPQHRDAAEPQHRDHGQKRGRRQELGRFEVRSVAADDPDLVTMLTQLDREYSARYGTATEELNRYPPARFQAPEGAVLLLFEDDACVAGGAFMRYDDETAEIKRIWTDGTRRGRGLARRLLAALEAEAADRGYRRAYLTTGPRQPEARALYLAVGYTPLFDLDADPELIGPLPFEKKLEPAEPDRRAG